MPRCANLPTITPERLSLLALAWLAPQPTLANFANRGRCSRLLLRYSLRIPIATRLAGLAWLASLANRLKPLIIKAFGSVVGKLARCANRLRSLRDKGFGNVVGRLAQRSFADQDSGFGLCAASQRGSNSLSGQNLFCARPAWDLLERVC